MFLTWVATLIALGAVTAPAASATDYRGSTASAAGLDATVDGGHVTRFHTSTARFPTCEGGGTLDPQELVYAGAPAAIVDGAFQLTGTSNAADGSPFQWAADGTLSADGREL